MKTDAEPRPEEIDSAYRPDAVEAVWSRRWDESGVFRADSEAAGEPFVITLPPPNVTGVLHMGHVLNHTLQDLVVRWRRMQGRPTLFLPGTDHAGIATQNMVERKLAKEGKDRRAMGREAFLEEVWKWKAACEDRIVEQMKRLGESCDWSRYRFTLDEGLSRAVVEVFVSLHERGFLYRGKRLINWCPGCRTALSDEEVEHEEVSASLYFVDYQPVEGGEPITIATTRPETILADTAVAVHPEDERYAGLVGRRVRLPVLDREIPVIADGAVDREFGTGALKVTPGHDPLDFEIGARHGLPALEMMSEAGTVTDIGGPYAGMDRFVARKAVLRDLEASGRLRKTDPIRHAVGHCYRCRTVVEPILSTQWFVRMKPLAEPAIAAVRSGRVRIEPERWEKVYFHWMENIRDWCISRQLWWGHRIPAWYCEGDGAGRPGCPDTIVAREKPAACPMCGGSRLRQDEDVLDTWFSSWLWPFSTLGWPDKTADLARFFPGHVLVTGNEILFFWVARMIMASLAFLEEAPFDRVLIHGIVRDAKGRKMSKTLGNSPDPIELIDRVGADALRFSIVYTTPAGQDVLWSEKSLEMGRNLTTKIWNAARLVRLRPGAADGGAVAPLPPAPELRLEDRWILSRARNTIASATAELESLRPNEAMAIVYDFFWHELCDWYLELAKRRVEGAAGVRVTAVLVSVFRATLALFHPVMPFLTEETARLFPGGSGMLAAGPWPDPERFPKDSAAEAEFGLVQRVISAVRTLRSEAGVPPGATVALRARPRSAAERSVLAREIETIRALARAGEIDLDETSDAVKKALTAVVEGAQVFLPVQGLIDIEKERGRLGKEIARLAREIENLRRKLADGAFLGKAPASVVQAERDKEKRFAEKLSALEKNLEMLAD